MQKRLGYLFDRYFKGEASHEEIQELNILVSDSEYDEQLKQMLTKAWESVDPTEVIFEAQKSDKIFHAIIPESAENTVFMPVSAQKERRFHWLWYAAAVFLVGLGLVWQLDHQQALQTVSSATTALLDLEQKENQTTLILDSGTPIMLNEVGLGQVVSDKHRLVRKTGKKELTYAPIGEQVSQEGKRNILSTARGDQYGLVLPDGSKVWLNACSSIEFPAVFTGKERNVKISGEAYFEIAPDKTKPFMVRFKDGQVKVLGTRFNIMAYPDEIKSKTTLVEGSISLLVKDQSYVLKPQHQATIELNGVSNILSVDVQDEVAWQNGWIHFKNASVQEVMRQINRWHAVEVVYDAAIPKTQFTGMVPITATIEEVMAMLQYAGIDCSIKQNKIRIN